MKQIIIISLLIINCAVGAYSISPTKSANVSADTLKVGDVCPDFNMENLNREKIAISSLRGKYVFIDVWASWCYPCRKQFPFLKELEEKITSDEIVFLGVNVDTRDFNWLGTVENLKPAGEQWHVLDSEFEDKFNIKYIPRFILLDKEGKILETKTTAPSKPETEVLLKKLLGL